MKWFLSLFKDSASEFKSLRSLTTSGVLIALGFALEVVAARSSTQQVKFSFLALALIAMLYGPAMSMIAGGILDTFSGILSGSVWPEFIVIRMIAGLIFGVFLYKAKTPYSTTRNIGETFKSFFSSRQGYLFMLRLFLSKLLVNVICNIGLNTLVLQYRLGGKTYFARLATAIPKNLLILPIEILLMLIILVPVYNVYYTYFRKARHTAKQ